MNEFILFTEHPDLHSSLRFIEEANNLGLKTSIINPYEQILETLPGKSLNMEKTLILHRVTGIRHQNYDLNLCFNLLSCGAKIFNSPTTFLKLRDKEQQAVFFHGHDINVIPTISFRKRPYRNDLEYINEKFSKYLKADEPSYILKTLRGNQGIGVNLIHGKKSMIGILETLWAIRDQEFLIQPYLEGGAEYRLLISAGKILGGIHRYPTEHDFRANSDRGNADPITISDLPPNVVEMAKKVHEVSGALYFALDIMEVNGELFLIEFNLVPGHKQMERLTGKNIAKEILKDALKEGES